MEQKTPKPRKHYQVIIALVGRGNSCTYQQTFLLADYSADDAAETARTMAMLMYPSYEASYVQSVGQIDGNGLIACAHEVA